MICTEFTGRLANNLFQIASAIGMGDKFNQEVLFPFWKYSRNFEWDYKMSVLIAPEVKEKHYHYYDIELPEDSNLKGYFQSEKWWKDSKKKVLKTLKFKKELKDEVKKGYDFSKPVIAIHVRRGDYVGHECYEQLPITYFYNALNQWSDWRECNILIFSDDISYCKIHFQCLENVQFASGNEIEDMCLASMCQRFILSNSSFSWWVAYLSGSKEVIRPDCLFRGEYAKTHNDKDFWIKEWKILKPDQKLDLKDVTFTIPVYYDHPDRQHNLNLSVCMIQHYLDTNVIIMENKHTQFEYFQQWCTYAKCDHKVFHRTKMLNDMAKIATTPIIFNWDADVVISPIQIAETVHKLRQGIELVFPYDGRFARILREEWFKKLEASLDVGILLQHFPGMEETAAVSVGGAIGYRKDEYLAIGGENENFISFGAEDVERIVRAEKLGLRVERVKGAMYHISHWCGVNSSTANPYFLKNRDEFDKVKGMGKEELLKYVESWK